MGLSGGLGNQFFQYASGLGIASTLGAELRLDGSWLRPDERWMPGVLGPRYQEASRLELARVGDVDVGERSVDKVVRELARHAVGGTRRLHRRSPARHEQRGPFTGYFDPSLFRLDLPALLRGWYQSERYFEHVAAEVDSHLRLPEVTLPAGVPDGQPVVAVSFRRGDYVRLGWQLPLAYYERALERMAHDVPGARFLVFGDDPDFVHLVTDWVGRYGPATDAYELTGGVLEQLALASACDHAVLANSSFAWWAAWLGERRAGHAPRLVLAPAAYPDRFGRDLVPDRWELLPSD